MKIMTLSIVLFGLGLSVGTAQKVSPDIQGLVDMVNAGQADRVRTDLPSLISRYPNNPGVLYIQALVTEEGAEAIRIYQSIVDNFPKSEWADDALQKVYQFYYSLGLYRTAELKLTQLRTEYPESPYLAPLSVKETASLPEERETLAVKTSTQVEQSARDTAVVAVTPQEQFVLQVGAFTVQANAERQQKFFEDLGYPVDIMSKTKDGRSLFLVLVGRYRTYDEAKAGGTEIKKAHSVESIVIAR